MFSYVLLQLSKSKGGATLRSGRSYYSFQRICAEENVFLVLLQLSTSMGLPNMYCIYMHASIITQIQMFMLSGQYID